MFRHSGMRRKRERERGVGYSVYLVVSFALATLYLVNFSFPIVLRPLFFYLLLPPSPTPFNPSP
jgi:hypothetical protein